MIKSMTGYGRGSASSTAGEFTAEIRTVNHRFRDVSLKVPSRLYPLEEQIRKEIEGVVSRGKADLFVSSAAEGGEALFEVNLPLAKGYQKALLQLKEELGLEGDLPIAQFAALRDIIRPREVPADDSALKDGVMPAVAAALASLDEMRKREGKTLKADLKARLRTIEETAAAIAEKQPVLVERYRTQLSDRISALMEGHPVDEARLAQEAAVIADRSDVTEEIVRLKSHIEQFLGLLETEGPVGRKFDFIVQEMNREINTLGSKSCDAGVSAGVIEMKSELEKVREQVQNIE